MFWEADQGNLPEGLDREEAGGCREIELRDEMREGRRWGQVLIAAIPPFQA